MDESPYPISVSNAAPSIANSLLTGDQLNMGTAGVLSTFTVEVGRKSLGPLLIRLFTSFFFFHARFSTFTTTFTRAIRLLAPSLFKPAL